MMKNCFRNTNINSITSLENILKREKFFATSKHNEENQRYGPVTQSLGAATSCIE